MSIIRLVLAIGMMIPVLLACKNNSASQADILKAKQMTIDSMNQVAATKKHIVDSMKREQRERQAAVNNRVDAATTSTQGQVTEQPRKKKGLSTPVKGAIIGAGVGAVTGAVIDKKHGEGAVVGGLIGAGAGAATGAIIDNQKKKKHKVKHKTASNQ